MSGSAIFALLFTLTAGAVAAQDRGRAVTTPPGGQLSSDTQRETAADQLSAPRRGRPAIDQLATERAGRPAAQISTPAASRQPLPGEVTGERGRAGGVTQLSTSKPSAAAPTSPSDRADSRPSGVVRVVGRDRCDPSTPAGRSEACANIIEARAAEYQAPEAPVLSPEQRLLLTQDPGQASGLRGAAERIARNDVDPDALGTQTLAAITREVPGTTPTPTPATPLSPTDAAVADLIGQIIGAAQAVPPR